jgi:predicted DCC family thiol-disulfide oxidoreductase YuxK
MASFHLVSPEGARLSGGAALAPLFRLLRGGRFAAVAFARFPRASDRGYRWVATHRIGLSRFVPRAWKRRAAARVREREAPETSGEFSRP